MTNRKGLNFTFKSNELKEIINSLLIALNSNSCLNKELAELLLSKLYYVAIKNNLLLSEDIKKQMVISKKNNPSTTK